MSIDGVSNGAAVKIMATVCTVLVGGYFTWLGITVHGVAVRIAELSVYNAEYGARISQHDSRFDGIASRLRVLEADLANRQREMQH